MLSLASHVLASAVSYTCFVFFAMPQTFGSEPNHCRELLMAWGISLSGASHGFGGVTLLDVSHGLGLLTISVPQMLETEMHICRPMH